MDPKCCAALAAAVLPTSLDAANLTGILGPISPVYQGNADGTSFTPSGWFPDAQFPFVWGGANEPATNLSWWMERRSGSMRLDYALKDGVWPVAQWNSPDERGYWIQTVYRPVDVDPSLRGTTVTLSIYPNNATYGVSPANETHVIDDNYLVGFAHIEDWNETTGKEVNGSRTVYSYDNGKNWKKGPLRAMGVCTIDTRTNPAVPRLVGLWQEYQGPRWRKTSPDIAKGVDGYTNESSAFGHGNLYGVTGIVWSRYLNKWLVMYGFNGSHGKDLQFSTTPAFDTYSAEPSVSIEKNEVPGRGVVAGAGDYPTLLGGFPTAASYPLPHNMEVGQLGWVYNKANGGLSGRAIHFIAPVEKAITWQGADAATSLVATLTDNLAGARYEPILMKGRDVAALGDEDADGVPNLIEHATGTPLDAPNPGPGRLSMEGGWIHFTYTRAAGTGARCIVEWSEHLDRDWRTEGITEAVLSSAGDLETVRASLARPADQNRFMRLRVVPASQLIASSMSAGAPVELGGGIQLSVGETEIPRSSGGSATWTFTRTGSTAADLTVAFGVSGTALPGTDYSVTGAASFSAAAGTIVIPAGETSASLVTTAAPGSGPDKTIILSAPQGLHLAATGNWNQTGGGFAGIADETHTLNFNSEAGGTFQNDIPVTKRVRSINFGANSGDHVINGNRLGVEAVNKWLSTGYAFYSINQYSPNTATFNTDIDTRSAALYLRSWDASGNIVLNGKVDMLGTGGVVVSGAGNVSIAGDLVDSGYSDFISGQPEFVAGVNPGRLIMAGDGLLSLGGNNTFTGRTEIKYGTVRIDAPGALRNSIVALKKHLGLTATTDFKLGGLDGTGNLDLGSYDLTLGNHNPPDCYPTGYSGTISGGGSITKVDSNTQRLGAINQHSGGTYLQGGVLEIPANNNTAFGSGPIQLDGGTLKATGAIVAANPVQVGPGGGTLNSNGRTIILNGPLSGSGNLYATGSGSLVLNSAGTYTGTLSFWSNIRTNQPGAFGTGALRLGGKLTLGADQTLSGLTTIATNVTVDTGPYTLTVDGPISVAGGHTLAKTGSGVLAWDGDSSIFAGDLSVQGGTIRRSQGGSFTHGSVALNGASLSLGAPGTAAATIDIAHESGKTLAIHGAASLILSKGAASGLAVNVGSPANPGAFALGDSSTALVTLGPDTKLLAHGQAETAANETFSPALVLTAPDLTGDFAAYSAADGFRKFTGYTARSGSFSTASDEVSNITAAAMLAATGEAKGLRIDGSHALTLTSRTLTLTGTDGKAGALLNSGSLLGGTLSFGTNKGYVYVSGQNANISSAISGSGGVAFTGNPGTKVTLNSWATSYSTRLIVAGTTLVLPNTTVMGAAYTPITLDGQGTLSFPYSLNAGRAITYGSGGAGIHVASGATFTNSADFSGPGEFRKTGAGTLIWTAGGTSTGPVRVEQGIVEYSAAAINGSTGAITVADGARVNLSTTSGVSLNHDFILAGSGPSGMGALSISGSGKTSNIIALSGNARIRANSGATFAFEGMFDGQGHDLDFGGSGRFGLHGAIDLDAADLTLSATPYLSVKATSSLICGTLTTAAGSTLELNTVNTRVASATIGGTLDGQKGRLTSTGAVTIASGGTLAGGLLDTPALFTIDGNLVLSAGSTLHAYLKGATGAASDGTGSLHGQVLITGSGTLGGTLKLVRDASFTPNTGDEIFVMLRNSGSGNFDQVILMEGTGSVPFSGAPGAAITIGGKTGILQYNRHSSINLSNPSTAFDVSIKF